MGVGCSVGSWLVTGVDVGGGSEVSGDLVMICADVDVGAGVDVFGILGPPTTAGAGEAGGLEVDAGIRSAGIDEASTGLPGGPQPTPNRQISRPSMHW